MLPRNDLFLILGLMLSLNLGYAQKPTLVVQTGHSDDVYAVALSPDQRILASGSVDNTIKLWDIASGSELRTLVGHTHVVASVAFSPDGSRLASGSQDNTIILWDVSTGRALQTLTGHRGHVSSVAFSPDGRAIASGSEDQTVKLWDTASGRELRTMAGHTNRVESVAFSPNGRMLASAGWDKVILWKVPHGTQQRTLDGHGFESVAFSPDGNVVAAGGQSDTIKMWEVKSGRDLRTLEGYSNTVSAISFSADGQILASSSWDKTIKLWDPATGSELRSWAAEDMLTSIAFSRDGKTLASGHFGKTVTLWDAATGNVIRTLKGHTMKVASVAFSPDGNTLAVGLWDDTAKIWDVAGGREVRTLAGQSNRKACVAFSPDGHTMALGSANEIRLWDFNSGRELRKLDAGVLNFVDSVVFSPVGTYLASGNTSSISLWNATNGRELWTLDGEAGTIMPVAFSPNARTLASGGEHNIKLWDVAKREELRSLEGHQGNVWSLAFSPDGRTLASGSLDDTIKLWDSTTGKELQTLSGQTAESLVFSPDGRFLASASWDKSIKIWEVATGQEVRTITGHIGPVSSVSFSPDGRILASGDEAGMVRLWDSVSGAERATLFSLGENEWVVSDPEGRFDTSNLDDIAGLNWVFPDEPYRPLPPEVFMREYYEPKLLAKVLRAEVLPSVRSLTDLNRAQPRVEVLKVDPEPGNGLVSVTVRVEDTQSSLQKDSSGKLLRSGAFDLRLFRGGHVVGQWPEVSNSAEDALGMTTPETERASWRRLHEISLVNGQCTHTFSHIHLPSRVAAGKIGFTAYAFNSDRVKSATSHPYEFSLPAASTAEAPSRAYLVTMGVNANQSHNLALELAVSSAEQVRALLRTKLRANYSEVVEIPLYSDLSRDSNQLRVNTAKKGDLEAVLDMLGGRPVDPARREEVDPKHELRAAGPDDSVVLYVASHGYADPEGNFYLLPYDTGANWGITEDVLTGCRKSPDRSAACNQAESLLAHAVSTKDLTSWWSGVDASEMVMILDSCHSGAVPGKEFRPGPLGDPGFGQLSYDKGMQILSASQPAQTEQGEWVSGGEGRTLLVDALETVAQTNPGHTLEEWLRDVEQQLPATAKQLYPSLKDEDVQRPVLLDFAKKTGVTALSAP